MKKNTRYLIAALAGILYFPASHAAPEPDVVSIDPPENILFVGNSFTYYNNSLHNHVKAMMDAEDKARGVIRSMTISGAYLEQHAPAMPSNLGSDEWDIVILQGKQLGNPFRLTGLMVFVMLSQPTARRFMHEVQERFFS